ncbi:hypothetical protein Droror1_Dr00023431 [Drosera rotundifolia]
MSCPTLDDELLGLCTAYEGKELPGKLQARLGRSPVFFANVTPRQAEVRSSPASFADAAPRQAEVRSSPASNSPMRFCPVKGDKVGDAPMVGDGTKMTAWWGEERSMTEEQVEEDDDDVGAGCRGGDDDEDEEEDEALKTGALEIFRIADRAAKRHASWNPGGESDSPSNKVAGTLQTHVNDLAHFIEKELPLPPVLVGHSFGGLIVQNYIANMRSEQVLGAGKMHQELTGAVLVCSVPPTGNSGLVWRYVFTKPVAAFKVLQSFNVPLMVLGGGGYTILNVARCWCFETAVAVGVEPDNKLPYNEYYEYFGPDYNLHINPSNMKNQNSAKDLERIRTVLLESLARIPAAQVFLSKPLQIQLKFHKRMMSLIEELNAEKIPQATSYLVSY